MRIKLDDRHVLCSDKYCCWCMKEVEKEDGSGTYEIRVSGFHRNFEDLVESYLEKQVVGSDAESIKELAKELKALKQEVRTWNKNREGSK